MRAALEELNHRFAVALDAMFRHGSNRARMGGLWRIFERPVNLSQIKDYEVYVPKERQMWLLKIKGRVQRCFYGSKAEFLADCQAIVDAARAYNTPKVGGTAATPGVIDAAQAMLNEGLRVLGEAVDLEYWEKRVEIERVRQQPNGFQQLLRGALLESTAKAGEAPLGWRWVGCDTCQAWRLVTEAALYNMGLGLEADAVPFYCSANVDRPGGAGCAEPAEWVESG